MKNTFLTEPVPPGTDPSGTPVCRPQGTAPYDAPVPEIHPSTQIPGGSGTSALFTCSADFGDEKADWKACVSIVFHSPHMCEAVAEGRGTSFHFVVGYQTNGCFLCVPSHDFGCELAALSDTFWNRERISAYLCPVDTITLANAVACLDELWARACPAEGRRHA